MADAKDAARGSRLSMESKKRHLDDLYRFALKKCDDKAAGTFVSFFFFHSLGTKDVLALLCIYESRQRNNEQRSQSVRRNKGGWSCSSAETRTEL